MRYFYWQTACKPGSVEDNHLSSLPVAKQIKRLSICERITLVCKSPCSRQGLPLLCVTTEDCKLLPYSFHLFLCVYRHKGSLVSVALSLGLPPVAVSDCRILRCPDFPLSAARAKRPLSRLPLHYTLNFHIIPNKKP